MASLDPFSTVGGGDGDGDRCLADFEAPNPVVHGNVEDVPAVSNLARNLAHDFGSHGGIGVIFEVVDMSSQVVVADNADEQGDGSSLRGEDQPVQVGGVKDLARDLEEVIVGASADRRYQGDFVARHDRMIGRDVLGVDGEHNGISHRIELREAVNESVHDQRRGERFGQVGEFDLASATGLGEIGEELYGEAHDSSLSADRGGAGGGRSAD